MAQAFNLTAQLNLQAPGNVNQVVNQIRRQLKPLGIQVNIQNAKNLAQANRSLSSFNKNAQASTKSMSQLNRTLQESARRFSVITIATGSFLALANAFKSSTKEAIAFERELVKIAQVTGKTVGQLGSLADEVTRLGTSLGASSSDLLNVARTLTQAGFAADQTKQALDILAKTSLGATFDNIQDTTEGAIALLRQFTNEARAAGGDIKFLEQSLDAINAVSKAFAVESSDLISVIRRTGGVFAAAGGEINELIALFTSVRATTRESAETIATGLRTIFTRIQRPETITQLREFGVELQDAQGNFVGAFEAFKRLSAGLKSIDPRTTAFSQIVEDLGGFRQVGKVIPLIQQFTTAQQALTVAQNASGSVAKDAETAQQSLGVQIQKVREQFDALIRKFVDSSAFRSLATGGLELAKAFIRIADSLEPLLPMLITLAGLKLGKGLAPALGSFVGIGKSVSGTGPVTKFATGGIVPGSGNRDTVPAMLTPGEFVIRKSSVNKIGAGNLAAMNAGRKKYAGGGIVAGADDLSSAFNRRRVVREAENLSGNVANESVQLNKNDNFRARLQEETLPSRIPKNFVNAGKQISDAQFEELAQRRFGGTIAGSGKPLDLPDSSIPTEVKRTKGKVSDAVLVDKLIRSFSQQGVKNTGGQSQITGGTDDLTLRGMRVVYSDQSKDLNYQTAEALGLKRSKSYLEDKKKTKKSDPVEDQIGDANFAFGGLVQKYAAGGIIQAKKAGAAILDPEAKNSYAENVTIDDVKKEFGRAATGVKFARGKDPFSKRFSATKFDVTTSGLNKETSDKFKATLNDSLVAGLDYAGASLGADLGVGAVSVDKSTKDNFINSLRAAQIGDAFENILSTFNNKGVFDSAVDPNRPFDFPNGLTSPLADNFDGLPKSFIDAKSSAAAASKDNLRGKILDQIKSELIADGIYNDSPLFKAPRKKALGGIIQKFAEGGVAEVQKAAYIFDFDDTLGTTEAKGFKDFNNPKFIENALATRYASLAKRRASQGDDIHVLTARYGSKGIIQAIQNFMSKNGIPTKSVMAVGGAFPNEREPGKRPGTTRKLGTASKKAKILSKLAKNYSNITFLDDNAENLLKAGQVEGVKAVEAEESKLFKKYAKGGAASDTVPALLTPGEYVFSKDAAQSIGYNTLNRMNKHGVQGYASGGAVGVQRYATGTNTLGATSVGTVNFAGISTASEAASRLSETLASMNVSVADQIPVLEKFMEELKKGGKVSEALNKAFKDTGVNVKKVSELKSKEANASKKFAAAQQLAAKRLEGFNSGLDSINKISGALQGFAFLGSSVAALTSQFSGLSDTTKQAIQETAGWVTSVIGIGGTIIQLGTEVASTIARTGAMNSAYAITIAAMKAEAGARGEVIRELLKEKFGGKGGGGGLGGLGAATVGITAFVVALTAAFAVLKFWEAEARASAQKLSSGFDDALKEMTSTGKNNASILANSARQEARARQEAAAASATSTKAITAGVVATFTAAGAAIGAFFAPVTFGLSIAVGAAIGAIAGAIGGFLASLAINAGIIERSVSKEEKAFEKHINGLLRAASALSDFVTSLNESEKEISEMERTQGLTDERRQEIRSTAIQRQLDEPGTNVIQAENLQNAFLDIVGLTKAQAEGKSDAELIDQIVKRTENLDNPINAGTASVMVDRFKIDSEAIEAAGRNLEFVLDETAKGLEATRGSIDPTKTFDELMRDESSAYKRAFDQRAAALRFEAQEVLKQAKERDRVAKEAVEKARQTPGDEDDKAAIEEQQKASKALAEAQLGLQESTKLLEEGERNIIIGINERDKAEKVARLAAIALRQAMLDAAEATKIFDEELKRLKGLETLISDISSGLSSPSSLTGGAAFSQNEVNAVFDTNKFKQEADSFISAIADPKLKAESEKARDAVIANSNAIAAFSDAQKGLLKYDGDLGGEEQVNKFLKDAGIDLSYLDEKIRDQITQSITKFSDEGTEITQEQFDQIIAPLVELGNANLSNVTRLSDLTQSRLSIYQTYLGELDKLNQEEVSHRKKMLEAQEETADLELKLANMLENTRVAAGAATEAGRGRTARTFLADRAAEQANRNRAAQRELDLAGVGVNAGDTAALAAAKQQIEKELLDVKKAISEAKQNLTGDAQEKELQRLGDEQQKLTVKTRAVNNEFDRLSDQSRLMNDMFAEMSNNDRLISENNRLIEKEAAMRGRLLGVLEEFVVGGIETRQQMARAAMGVNYAISTGTLQNQDEEQRRATVGLLDKLGDAVITYDRATGKAMTAQDVKQRLVLQDAIRMGFPPEIAEKLATATSEEQKLIDANMALVDANEKLADEIRGLRGEITGAQGAQAPTGAAAAAARDVVDGRANGGLIQYRANGGTIFKPKGTDTVPAMLTPGEFVIRKSAVDKVGLGTLQAINNGGDAVGLAKGGVVYRANGSDLPEYSPYYGTNLEKRYKEIDAEAARARGGLADDLAVIRGEKKSTGVNEKLVDSFQRNMSGANNLQNISSGLASTNRGFNTSMRLSSPADTNIARRAALQGEDKVKQNELSNSLAVNTYRTINNSGAGTVPIIGEGVNALMGVAGAGLNTAYGGGLEKDLATTGANVAISAIPIPGINPLVSKGAAGAASIGMKQGVYRQAPKLGKDFAAQFFTGETKGVLREQFNLAKGGPVYLDDGGSMPHRHPHWDYEGEFMWLSKTENDHAKRGIEQLRENSSEPIVPNVEQTVREGFYPSLSEKVSSPDHVDFGKSLQQDNTLAPDMQNFYSSAKTARNIVTGGDLGEGFTDLFSKQIVENAATISGGVRDTSYNLGDTVASSVLGVLDYLTPESADEKKQRQIQDRNNFEERVSSKVLREQAEATERFQKQQADARKAKEDYYKANPIDYNDKSKFDFENFGLPKTSEAPKKPPKSSAVPISSEFSMDHTAYDTSDDDLFRVQTGSVTELNFGQNTAGAQAAAISSGVNVQTQVGNDNMFDPDVMQEKMEQDALTARLSTSKTPGQVKGTLDPVDAILNKGDKYEEFSKYADIELNALNEEIKNTFNPKYRQELEDKRDRLYSALESGVLTKEAFEKFNVEQDAAKEDRRQESKMSFGGSKAAKARRDAANAGFVGPLRPGKTGADQGRDNASTRRKARLAEQRQGASQGKSDKDIDTLRRARGMRSRGKNPDGSRIGQGYGLGGGMINAFSRYGGGYGNQMMGGGYGGGYGGFGGGYGGGMLPFGYIPGSPYNSMLGAGGYNIPRFSPYMMFGNNARFFNSGGAAGGDTVPAMLTPGEFVMSKNAVSKYGTGFMQKLNRGKIQGYNRGGPVQYRQTGGIMDTLGGAAQSLGIDTSKIEGVFSGFVDNFSSVFDNIMGPFNGIAETLRGISESFGNFSMNHTVNVEGMVNLGGLNVEAIKSELTQHITDLVGTEIQRVNEANAKTYKT